MTPWEGKREDVFKKFSVNENKYQIKTQYSRNFCKSPSLLPLGLVHQLDVVEVVLSIDLHRLTLVIQRGLKHLVEDRPVGRSSIVF